MVDAFIIQWQDGCYLFPPLPVINKAVNKFISDNVNYGVLITPFWPSAVWFPTLLSCLIDVPFLLPSDCVQDEATLLPKHCRFLAWPIGCDRVLQQAFRERLPLHNSVVSIRKPFAPINEVGNGSVCGVLNKRLVTVRLP